MSCLETKENDKYLVEIYHDDFTTDPRIDFDHVSTMLCGNGRYSLGDKTDIDVNNFSDANELESYLYQHEKALIVKPLYLLDHSGLWIRTSRFHEDPQGWDTSFIGFIYVTRDSIKKFYNKNNLTKKMQETLNDCIEGEIKEYNQYLSGDVYGYKMYEKTKCDCKKCVTHLDEVDSCWGFYGRESIDDEVESLLKC